MPIKLEVQEPRKVEEGRHNAEIVEVQERLEPFHYIDVYYRIEDADVTIKEGYAAYISDTSKLGKLLNELKVKMEVGTMIDLEEALVRKKITLMTINVKGSKGGMFAQVVDGSVHLRQIVAD